MRRHTVPCLFLATLCQAALLHGCGDDADSAPPQQAVEPSELSGGAGEVAVAAPEPTAAPAEAAPADPAQAVAAGEAATDEAAAAGEAVPTGDGEGSHCEQAYVSIRAMIDAMTKQLPPAAAGQVRDFDRGQFIAACNEMPPKMQQCMVLSYGMQHREECEAAKNELDPATIERLQRVMGKNRN